MALLSLSLSMLLSSLGTSIANVGLPALARAFAAPFQAVQWIVLAYLLASTTLIVGVGRLGDVAGRRRLLLGGIALYTAASAACGLAPTLGLVIAARALQGLGAAVMMALSMALVAETVPQAKTGSAMGLLGTTSAIGTALGPSLGGLAIAAAGWRALFLVNVPLGLAAFFLGWRWLPAERRDAAADAGFDAAGTLLLGLTLAAYALGVTVGRDHFGARNLALLAGAGGGALLFVLVEARAPSPLVRLALLRDAALRAGLGLSALVATVMMATLVVGPFYLTRALGLDSARAGLVLAVGPVVAALGGLPAGRLVDRYGAGRVMLAGLGAIAAGAAALALLPTALGVAGYVAAIVVVTVGYALFQAANNTAVMRDVGPGQRGVVSGLLNLARNLGLITGAAVMGALFAHAAAARDVASAPPAAVAAAMHATFAVAAVAVAVAVALAAGGAARSRSLPGDAHGHRSQDG